MLTVMSLNQLLSLPFVSLKKELPWIAENTLRVYIQIYVVLNRMLLSFNVVFGEVLNGRELLESVEGLQHARLTGSIVQMS